jgi:hypothetical protein
VGAGIDVFGVELQSGAAEEEQADEAVGIVEAEGASGDGAGLAVEALDAAVVQAGGDVGDDAVEVGADGLRELLEGPEARPSRPADPILEATAGDVDLAAVEDLGERLLEQVGAVERLVGLLDDGELGLLVDGEVPGVLLQRITGVLERCGLVGALEGARLLASHLVDRVVGEALDVEAVEAPTPQRPRGVFLAVYVN